jgi:adenylate kinase family enzyme
MRRVSVVGNSGSGKTTLAIALARALGAPHLELDAIFHQPGWQPLDAEVFRARVAEFIAADSWVVDGNYSAVRDLVWQRADTVVWLDLPRRLVMGQLIRRTLARMARRTKLWNGNTERWRNLLSADPAESILRWAWTQHDIYRARYQAAQDDPANRHLTFVRLPGRTAAARLVAGLGSQPAGRAADAEAGGVAGE